MTKSVAIVGKAATAALAPYDDPAWDIWGLAWVKYPRQTLLFDIHSPSFKAEPPFTEHFNSHKNPSYFERVNGENVPVMCDPEAIGDGLRFAHGVPYPMDEVAADLPRIYLDCTVSYMLALAILQKVDRIALWGCHFAVREEFRIQLPSVTWLCGLAEGRGIELTIGPGAPLLTSGYEAGRYGVNQNARFTGRGNI